MSKGRRYEEPKLNLKKVFAVVIAIVVLIMVIVMINGILSSEDEGNITSEDYFAAYQNNKWGVINSKGEIVIDPSYAEMIVIPNSKKDVFLCTYDVNYETGEYKTKALNSKNEDILTGYEQIEAIGNTDEGQNLTYNQNVLRVRNNGKYGLIDFSGKEIAPCNYEEITAIPDVEDKFLARKDGNYGVLNEEGREVVTTEYAEILNFGEKENTGFIVRNTEGKYGLVDNLNNKVLELNYDGIKNIHSGDLYVVKQGENEVLINKDGTQVLASGYDEITEILTNTENGMIFTSGNKYGVMKTTGEVVIPAEYDSLKEAKSGILVAKQNEKYGVIDLSRQELVPFEYNNITYNERADIYIAEDESYNNDIIDNTYTVRQSGILVDLNEDGGYIELRQDDNYKYYNFRFEEQKEADVHNNRTLFLSKQDGKYGFVDKDGKVVVNYEYDDATEQNSFGFAGVKKDGVWGSIDRNGNVVQEPTYNLDDYLQIDFIGRWHYGKDINMNYYRLD